MRNMKWATSTLALALLFTIGASPLSAGVVFQVETTYHSGPKAQVQDSQMSVQKPNLKMEVLPGKDASGSKMMQEMIFLGKSREMVAINHQDKTYMVINAKTIEKISNQFPAAAGGGDNNQMQEAMKELDEKLAELDPKQREMVEKMMKGKMKLGSAAKPERSPSEFRRTDEKATKHGYPCVRYDVFRDEKKIQELWVTDWKNIPGSKESRTSLRKWRTSTLRS